ncbi:hypothetical protein CDAR_503611 [Caerostris darwini]|uniref:Uncharacterized protein n=1 Tax=Caerostris darwini TaxID=1538125 RepID=A0AAV4NR13_9ARAC|nr:hypothetical protein CDAR_503611 [Caerostris darwini]
MSPYFTNNDDLINWFMLSRFIRPDFLAKSWNSFVCEPVFGWPYKANIPPGGKTKNQISSIKRKWVQLLFRIIKCSKYFIAPASDSVSQHQGHQS